MSTGVDASALEVRWSIFEYILLLIYHYRVCDVCYYITSGFVGLDDMNDEINKFVFISVKNNFPHTISVGVKH